MKNMSFRWFGPDSDSISLKNIRQIPGTKQVVSALYDIDVGEVWPKERILALKEQIENAGLKFEVVESVNIHDDIKIGLPTRDHYIENYIKTIQNLSEYGIKVICYNFMPIFDWVRTDLHYQLADGSNAMAFQHEKVEGNPEDIVKFIQDNSNGYSLPGWEPERLNKVKRLFEAYRGIDAKRLTDNLKYFLKAIIPICEKCNIRMAMHPDDPPRSLFGLPRIFKNRDDMLVIERLYESKYNGFTICSGSLGENQLNDLPSIIREFVKKDRVPFIHARNIKFFNIEGDFHESSHLSSEGSLDMYEIMKAIVESGFNGYLRPDHGRNIWGENGRPGYGLYDRALGITYLNGLYEAIKKDRK